MATVGANIHAALIARAETLAGFDLLWPERTSTSAETKQPRPLTEHVEVWHVPNVSDRWAISGAMPLDRRGFLYLAHYAPVGDYAVVYAERAGLIAAHFPRDLRLQRETSKIRVYKTDVGRGVEDDGMWRTLVSVDYRGFA